MQEQFIPTTGIGTFRETAEKLAEYGRYGDVYIVHAAEGETVVPMEVFDANPKLKDLLFAQMRELDLEPERYIVGNELNSINPVTGQPEFFLKKLFKGVKKVLKVAAPVIGAIAGSFIPGVGAVIGPALGSFAASKLAGASTKNALLGAALAGAGGYALSGSQAALAGGIGSGSTLGSSLMQGYGLTGQGISGLLPQYAGSVAPLTAAPTATGVPGAAAAAAAPSGAGGFGSTLAGMGGGIMDFATKNPGMALAIGSGLLAALEKPEKIKAKEGPTGSDLLAKDPGKYGLNNVYAAAPISTVDASYESLYGRYPEMRMPFVLPGVQPPMQFPVTPVVNAASGGEIVGPGTGTSDSIPAMLSDGEFVITANAVKGAGGGDRRKGAQKLYQLMKKFENLNG